MTSGSLLTGDVLEAVATGSVTNVAQTATGNNPIAAGYKVMHGDEDVTANYVITPVAGKLTVNPKAVTVTAKSDAFTYDGTPHSNSGYEVAGLVGNDAISAVVTGSITFPYQSPAANVLTSYAFTIGTPGNYSVTTANGSLTMTNAAVAITITAASEEWTYDGNTHSNAAVTVTSGSLLTGDALVATATGSVTNVWETAVGNNPIAEGYKVMHGTQDVTANYVITPVAGELTIKPRTVTVSVADKTVEYNGSVQSGNTTCTFSNLVSGQTATIGYTAASGKLVSEIPYDNGSYANDFMVKAGQTDVTSNYTLAQQTSGKLTIKDRTNKHTINVVANSNTGNVYDGTVKSVSGIQSLVFSFNNNLFTISGLTTSNPSSVNACELTNAISGTPAVTDADGNDVTEQFNVITYDGVLEILKRPVTVSVADKTVEYNGSEQYGSTAYSFTNVVAGQTATIDYTAASGTMESATPYNNGSYGSNFKVMLGETNVTSNYTLTLMAKGKLIINSPPLVVTALDSTKIYDGDPLTPSFTYEPNDITPTFQFSVKVDEDSWEDWTDEISIINVGTLTYKVKGNFYDFSVESNEATLTITDRQPLLGVLTIPDNDPIKAKVCRTALGDALVNCLLSIPHHHPEVQVLHFCLMPDHLHAVLYVRRPMPTGIGTLARGFWQAAKKLGRAWTRASLLAPNTIRLNCKEGGLREETTRFEAFAAALREEMGNDAYYRLAPIFTEMPFIRAMGHTTQLPNTIRYIDMNPQRLAV